MTAESDREGHQPDPEHDCDLHPREQEPRHELAEHDIGRACARHQCALELAGATFFDEHGGAAGQQRHEQEHDEIRRHGVLEAGGYFGCSPGQGLTVEPHQRFEGDTLRDGCGIERAVRFVLAQTQERTQRRTQDLGAQRLLARCRAVVRCAEHQARRAAGGERVGAAGGDDEHESIAANAVGGGGDRR